MAYQTSPTRDSLRTNLEVPSVRFIKEMYFLPCVKLAKVWRRKEGESVSTENVPIEVDLELSTRRLDYPKCKLPETHASCMS